MMKKWILIILMAFCVVPLLAQDTPSRAATQPTVLTVLARQVGRQSLTLSDVGDWNWFFGTYDYVKNLGCIGAPTTAPAGGRWQRWEMTYGSTPYTYLITDDAQTLVLCNEAALTTPTVPPPATAVPVTIVPPPAATPGIALTPIGEAASGTLGGPATPEIVCAIPPRLVIGGAGRVTPGDANWVYEAANRTSRKVGEIPGEGTLTVIQGPVCDPVTGMNYWLVQGNGLTGWTSEGQNGEYWLEPVSSKPGINPSNAARLKPAAWVAAFPVAIQNVIFSPLSRYFVVMDTTGRAALYDATTQSLLNELRAPGANPQPFTLIRFSADDAYLVTADTANNVYIWDVASVRALGQITTEKNVVALAFSPDASANRVLAVATDDGMVRLWGIPVVTPQTPPLMMQTLPAPATSLEFSPDGRMLIALDATSKMLALWEVGG